MKTLSHRENKQRIVVNKTKCTFVIKEYAPKGFAIFRNDLSLSMMAIETFLKQHWFVQNPQNNRNFRITSLSRFQKNVLLRSLLLLIQVWIVQSIFAKVMYSTNINTVASSFPITAVYIALLSKKKE